jgi:hypothetical protein
MSALELRSLTCCLRSSGGAPGLNVGGFYRRVWACVSPVRVVFGLGVGGDSPRLAARVGEKRGRTGKKLAGVYHSFGHVFRPFGLFLAWAPSGG